MRVTFETLPGWPTADEPSLLMWLLVLLGIPLAIALVIMLIGIARRWRRTDPTLEAADRDAAMLNDYAYDVRHSMALGGATAARTEGAADAPAVGAQVENLEIEQRKVPNTEVPAVATR